MFQKNHWASLLLTGYKKFGDNAIVSVDVSFEDSELDSWDLVDLIKRQVQPFLALAEGDVATNPNDGSGHVFHPHILQIHPRSVSFYGHFERGDVVVLPFDPTDDGQLCQTLVSPKTELSPGWDVGAPGPARNNIRLNGSSAKRLTWL